MVHPLQEGLLPEPWLERQQIKGEMGAWRHMICQENRKDGQPCSALSLTFAERPVCSNHATDKEREINRVKQATAEQRYRNEHIFGEW